VSIQVVAGVQSREFLLATIDEKLAWTRYSREVSRQIAAQSHDDAPIAEQMALTRVQVMTDSIDFLLEKRSRVSRETAPDLLE